MIVEARTSRPREQEVSTRKSDRTFFGLEIRVKSQRIEP